MTFGEAVALQPAWVGVWMNVLAFGAVILPLTLFIWKQSRVPAVVTLIASALSVVGVGFIFNQMGYVKLLGLAHIIFWTPLCFYLFKQIKREDMPSFPRWIMVAVVTTIIGALAFDYVDTARWLLGERQNFAV